MTDDEKKAAELTAEVFAETFMRLLKERLRIQIIGNNLMTGALGSGGESSVVFNVSLVDIKAREGIPMNFATEPVQIKLKRDPWGNHYLHWGP